MTQPTPFPATIAPSPCRSAVTFACRDLATTSRIRPLAMLPDSTVPAEYVPVCDPCYDTESEIYAASAVAVKR